MFVVLDLVASLGASREFVSEVLGRFSTAKESQLGQEAATGQDRPKGWTKSINPLFTVIRCHEVLGSGVSFQIFVYLAR